VTNAKLHALVNSATVTGISNSEIASDAAIASSKLADIAGSKLTTLSTITSGAGVIPAANLTSVAQKGSNSDITALTGLSTPLTIAQGGTNSATASAARTALGLGTAAVLDVGTTASKVVQLDVNAKLPAVDGSQLTGITAGDARFTTGSFSRNLTTASDLSITSVGFSPKLVIFSVTCLGTDGQLNQVICSGQMTPTAQNYQTANMSLTTSASGTGKALYFYTANKTTTIVYKSMDADGFTITTSVTAGGFPTTATISYTAFR
jgi:hypothetical protein